MAEIVLRNPITVNPVPEGATCKGYVSGGGGVLGHRCGKPAKTMVYQRPDAKAPVPMCGVHAAGRRRRYENELDARERAAGARRRRDEIRKQEARAENLATFLTEQLGVTFSGSPDGLTVRITAEDAAKIYHAGAVLAELATYDSPDSPAYRTWRINP